MRHLFLLFLLGTIISCQSKKNSAVVPSPIEAYEDIGNYISEYSDENIYVDQDIVIRFSGAVIDPSKIGSTLSEQTFSINPAIPGKAYWKDMATLVFDPTGLLEYNTNYIVSLKLGSLFDSIPENLQTVEFPFKTHPLNFNIYFNQINYSGNSKKDHQLTVTGTIEGSQIADEKAIESFIEAKQEGQNLDVVWEHQNRQHHFTIGGIERKEEESTINVKWSGKPLSSSFQGDKYFTIYPKTKFTVINIQASRGNAREVYVDFSDELDRSQDLNGLITINNDSKNLQYTIKGSRVIVYPKESLKDVFDLKVYSAVQSSDRKQLQKTFEQQLSFEPIKPQLKLSGRGTIVPGNDFVIFPFQAINLKGVSVEIVEIFQNNVLQFLQYNALNHGYGLEPVGRIIHREEVTLPNINPVTNSTQWAHFSLDLKRMISPSPGSIYQVRIGFNQKHVIEYPCKDQDEHPAITVAERDGYTSIMDWPDDYRWSDRNNPCKSSYYESSKFISRNVLASNLGVIVKRTPKQEVHVAVSNILTTDPLSGVSIDVYDFQQQKIGSASTDQNGLATITPNTTPSFLILKHKEEYGYIQLQDQYANSLSEFEVSGKSKVKAMDAYIYGERGVWRPGDTIHLNCMLISHDQEIPSDYPLKLMVKDAKGREVINKTLKQSLDGLYYTAIPTQAKAPTGNWTATYQSGNQTFRKILKVETIKPNRLKIQYDQKADEAISFIGDNKLNLTSKWLHGATAAGLKAKVNLQLKPQRTTFKGWSDYVFDDPARKVDPIPLTIFDGNLDEKGKAQIPLIKNKSWQPSGMLKATFNTKVFERGGNFSEDFFSVDAHPYNHYVGIDFPTSKWGDAMIPLNQERNIPVVLLDQKGKPLPNKTLEIGLYTAEWHWWYDRGANDRFAFSSSDHKGAVDQQTIQTDQKGQAVFPLSFDEWGNYMVRVCDPESGHCTGKLFYAGYAWRNNENRQAAIQLKLVSDKNEYQAGENMVLEIPSNEQSNIFVSIENGQEVLQAFWVDGKKDVTKITIPATKEMNSYIYAHVHLIQPHNHGENDLPLRMYGVLPIKVIDPDTRLNPFIHVKEELQPNATYEVIVGEEQESEMTYTLAVVDEGLLGLTRFKTPNPWLHFFSKPALNVKTWDLYDYILTNYGGKVDRLISIGGDGSEVEVNGDTKVNRFKPVVTHLGPFKLENGKRNKHQLKMPNYVGAVRVMVVAKEKHRFGSAESTSLVKQPVMVLGTMPRVLGPNETLDIPANVFAMDDDIKSVDVKIESSGDGKILGKQSKVLSFNQSGDQTSYFKFDAGQAVGIANVHLSAQSGKHTSKDDISVEIRNPNPFSSEVLEKALQPGEKWTTPIQLFGTKGSNEGVIEVSSVPSMNLDKRLKYLIRYPYGCLEQTVSSVYPQLYLKNLTELDGNQTFKISKAVQRAIERLSLFQKNNGSFSYWPQSNAYNEWSSIYATDFLIDAKEQGFFVSESMLRKSLEHLSKQADRYQLPQKITSRNYWTVFQQAYTLYVLAKAGQSNIGAMNRMRTYRQLTAKSAHLLAGAFHFIGKSDIAQDLINNRSLEIKPYVETGFTYGNPLRDFAMMLEVNHLLGNADATTSLIRTISREMSGNRWYSTQTTAFVLRAMGLIMKDYDQDNIQYTYQLGNQTSIDKASNHPFSRTAIPVEDVNQITITNTSNTLLFARVIISGQRPPGIEEEPKEQDVMMDVKYMDLNGDVINIESIPQGTDFIAQVTIKNMGSKGNIEEVALSHIFPSGWEILNERMTGIKANTNESAYEYRDIRDDRVYTFFDIGSNQTLTFTYMLNATYAGRFYHPPVKVEAMYDNEIQAVTKGKWVEVNAVNE